MDLRHSQCLEKFHNIGVNNFILDSFLFYRHVVNFSYARIKLFYYFCGRGPKCAKNLMCSRIASDGMKDQRGKKNN